MHGRLCFHLTFETRSWHSRGVLKRGESKSIRPQIKAKDRIWSYKLTWCTRWPISGKINQKPSERDACKFKGRVLIISVRYTACVPSWRGCWFSGGLQECGCLHWQHTELEDQHRGCIWGGDEPTLFPEEDEILQHAQQTVEIFYLCTERRLLRERRRHWRHRQTQ